MVESYSADITRAKPGCILFLLDMSSSMTDPFEHGMTRAGFLADALNRTLTELAAACKRTDGVRHYFDIGLLTYSGNAAQAGLAGKLAGRTLVSIADLAANPVRVERRIRKEPDGAGGIIEVEVPFPVFFEPQPTGATPMCSALRKATRVVAEWCETHAASFPPIVMHITDGEATDGQPGEVEAAARTLTNLRTSDGYALLINLHIAGGGAPVRFPMQESAVPQNPSALALFRSSSTLPPPLLERCFRRGLHVQAGSRAYIHNGAMEDVVAVFDIGTKAAAERTALTPAER
nr:vWA domain-containing protein [uncultured Rhodopila sp.]